MGSVIGQSTIPKKSRTPTMLYLAFTHLLFLGIGVVSATNATLKGNFYLSSASIQFRGEDSTDYKILAEPLDSCTLFYRTFNKKKAKDWKKAPCLVMFSYDKIEGVK